MQHLPIPFNLKVGHSNLVNMRPSAISVYTDRMRRAWQVLCDGLAGLRVERYRAGSQPQCRDGVRPGINARMGSNSYLEVDNPGLVNRRDGDPTRLNEARRVDATCAPRGGHLDDHGLPDCPEPILC
jgi:hypothetical protein